MRATTATLALAAALAVVSLAGCGGAPTPDATSPRAEPPPDECVLALRFDTEETTPSPLEPDIPAAGGAPKRASDEPYPRGPTPSTDVSLVVICRAAGRSVVPILTVSGFCRSNSTVSAAQAPTPADALLHAFCFWPMAPSSTFFVTREGDRLLVFEGARPAPVRTFELPPHARLRVLAGAPDRGRGSAPP